MKLLVNSLLDQPGTRFTDVIAGIDQCYAFAPTAFQNGEQYNEANQNNGSCKVFALALLLGLNVDETLRLFCEHYESVLNHPDADDHQNIRQFMAHGFDGLRFTGVALIER